MNFNGFFTILIASLTVPAAFGADRPAISSTSADETVRRAYQEFYRRIKEPGADRAKLSQEILTPAIQAQQAAIRQKVDADVRESERIAEMRGKKKGASGGKGGAAAAPSSPSTDPGTAPAPGPEETALSSEGIPSEVTFKKGASPVPATETGSQLKSLQDSVEGKAQVDEVSFDRPKGLPSAKPPAGTKPKAVKIPMH